MNVSITLKSDILETGTQQAKRKWTLKYSSILFMPEAQSFRFLTSLKYNTDFLRFVSPIFELKLTQDNFNELRIQPENYVYSKAECR